MQSRDFFILWNYNEVLKINILHWTSNIVTILTIALSKQFLFTSKCLHFLFCLHGFTFIHMKMKKHLKKVTKCKNIERMQLFSFILKIDLYMKCVQKRINIAHLFILKGTSLHNWPLVGIWKLNFGKIPSILGMVKTGSLCLNVYTNNVVYAKCLFSTWESGMLVHARQRVPIRAISNKHPGHWGSNELPWFAIIHTCCHSPLGELSIINNRHLMSCVTALGEDLFKYAQFTRLPQASFALAVFGILSL